jgi:hypothetical protein
MAKYRVMAELTQLYEVEVEASSEDEAMELAGEVDFWDVWDDTGLSDDFKILSAEEVE